MASILLSGPAGSGKSQEARRLLKAASVPTIMIDFQTIYAGLLGIERMPNGRYPERLEADAYALPMTEYARRVTITGAVTQDVDAIVTNSDGSLQRREYLLSLLPGASERVIDPGLSVVTERLSVDGTLSDSCRQAIDRWYGRL